MSKGGPEGRWRRRGESAGCRHAARHPPGARDLEWEEEARRGTEEEEEP